MVLHEKAHKLAATRYNTLEDDCTTKHGGKYDYSEFVFKNLTTKSTITCPVHGAFEQTMQAHLKGECPKCARLTVITKVEMSEPDFLVRLNEIHPNLSLVTYSGYKVKTQFKCKLHPTEPIVCTPTALLRYEYGCKACASSAMTLLRKTTHQDFLVKLQEQHSGNVTAIGTYEGSKAPIEFVCERHEEVFTKRPFDVLQGRGCNICGGLKKYRKYLQEPTILYYIYLPEFDLYKVGITIKRVGITKRFHGYSKVEVLSSHTFLTGKAAYEAEQAILKDFSSKLYKGVKVITAGNKELFTEAIFESTISNKYLLKCED